MSIDLTLQGSPLKIIISLKMKIHKALMNFLGNCTHLRQLKKCHTDTYIIIRHRLKICRTYIELYNSEQHWDGWRFKLLLFFFSLTTYLRMFLEYLYPIALKKRRFWIYSLQCSNYLISLTCTNFSTVAALKPREWMLLTASGAVPRQNSLSFWVPLGFWDFSNFFLATYCLYNILFCILSN